MNEMAFGQSVKNDWLFTARKKAGRPLTTDELIKILNECKIDGRWDGACQAANLLEEPRRSIELKEIMAVYDKRHWPLSLRIVAELLPNFESSIELRKIKAKYGRLRELKGSDCLRKKSELKELYTKP